jgi:hypothetical protein
VSSFKREKVTIGKQTILLFFDSIFEAVACDVAMQLLFSRLELEKKNVKLFGPRSSQTKTGIRRKRKNFFY